MSCQLLKWYSPRKQEKKQGQGRSLIGGAWQLKASPWTRRPRCQLLWAGEHLWDALAKYSDHWWQIIGSQHAVLVRSCYILSYKCAAPENLLFEMTALCLAAFKLTGFCLCQEEPLHPCWEFDKERLRNKMKDWGGALTQLGSWRTPLWPCFLLW